MKCALLLFACLLIAARAEAGFSAPTHCYNNGTTGTSITCTLGTTPSVGDVVAVAFLWYDGTNNNAGTVTIADGNSNAYTVTSASPSNTRPTTAGVVYLAYFIASGTPHATITVSYTTASALKVVSVDRFPVSGGTAAFDSNAAGTGTTGAAINTPTVTVSGSNELVYSAGLSDHVINSVDSPWTQIYAGAVSDPTFASGVGYILARSSNVAIAMTENSSAAGTSGWDSMGMSFTFTPTGGTCPKTLALLGVGCE